MSGLHDARPDSLDVLFRPGDPYEHTLNWPAGELAGRTFTSTLAGEAITVAVVGDVMTVSATGTQTDLPVGVEVEWQLVDDLGGGVTPVALLGVWTPDNGPRARSSGATTVVVDGGTITVEVPGTGATQALAARVTTAESDIDDLETADTAHLADDTAHGNPLAVIQAHKDRLHVPFVTRPAGWGSWWETARLEADTRQVIVQAWGDSITAGQGATNPITQGYIALVGDALRAEYGDGGTGFLSWGAVTTITGTWTVGMGFGGGAGTATAAASLGYTALQGTILRIYHKNASITGAFRWRIDGGSWTTVSLPPATGFGIEPGFVEVPVADTIHTIDIEWVSGTVTIHGVAAVRSTGVIMQRCAQSGRSGSDYSRATQGSITIGTTNLSTTITSAAPGAFSSSLIGRYLRGTGIPVDTTVTATASATSATISKAATATGTVTVDFGRNPTSNFGAPAGTVEAPFGLAPALGRADLLIIALGANDPSGSYTPANLIEGLSAILRPHTAGGAIDYSPDVVVLIEHFGNWFDVAGVWPALISSLASVAESHGAALIDVWGLGRRSWKHWNDLGYFADTIHPSTLGHEQYAAPLIDLLTA